MQGFRSDGVEQRTEIMGSGADRTDDDAAVFLTDLDGLIELELGRLHDRCRQPNRGAVTPLFNHRPHLVRLN